MKVQQVSNYTTQYSSNKTQKSNNNPNFGYKVNGIPSRWQKWRELLINGIDSVVGNPNISLRHLPDTAFDIRGFGRKEVREIKAHFDKITEEYPEIHNSVQLVIERKGKVICASVSDGRPYLFKHFGNAQSFEKPELNNPQKVITLAFQRYLEKMHPGESSSQGVNFLISPPKFQIAMA